MAIKKRIINQIHYHVLPSILEDSTIGDRLLSVSTQEAKSVESFVNKIFLINCTSNNLPSPENWKGGRPRIILQIFSNVFPLGKTIINYLLAYEAAHILVDSPVVCSVFAVITVVPTFMLDVMAITNTSGEVYDAIYNKAKKRNTKNFTSTFYPKINTSMPIASVFLSGLSVAGDWYVAYQTLKDSSLSSLRYVLPTMVFVSNCISESFFLRGIANDAIMFFSLFRQGTVKESANKIGRLEKLCTTIKHASTSSIKSFWYSVAGRPQ